MDIPVKIRFAAVILLAAIIPACKNVEQLEKKQYYSGDKSKTSEKAQEKPVTTPHLETLLSIQEAFISVAEKVTPSVVNISTVQHISGGRGRPPFEVDPFFRDFFGRSEEHTSELKSHLNLVCRLLLEKKKQTRLSVTAVLTPLTCRTGSRTLSRC